jgi:hypothetical protein
MAWIGVGAAVVAVGGAASAVIAYAPGNPVARSTAAVAAGAAFAGPTTRPYEIRLAYPGAADYRPQRAVVRGDGSAAGAADRVSYAALGALESRGDVHGLAIARVWNGEKPDDVRKQLAEIAVTPAIRSDRAALAMLTTHSDSTEEVLGELEALRDSPDVAAARAARWNRALLLAQLDLPLSAAQAFEAIAAEAEPGWSEEAGRRAKPLAERGREFQRTWQRAADAGKALVAGGAPVPRELIRLRPGVLRAYFYSAVRTAPSRERVAALAPMAAELDQLAAPDRRVLSDYVQRVARADFTRRAPLAAAYAALLQRQPVPAAQQAQLVAETASADVADIAMAAMLQRGVAAEHAAWLRAQTARTGDPWQVVELAREEADAAVRAGNWLGAEAILRGTEAVCATDVAYQCLAAQRQLGRLYTDIHRVHDARAVLLAGVRAARAAGEWGRLVALLWQLAEAERFHSATATVRAYAGELLRMNEAGKDCANLAPTFDTLTGAALIDADGPAARRYLVQAQACKQPELYVANHLADIARLDPQPGDLAELQAVLGRARAGRLRAAEQVMADEIEGRLVIESDRAAGAHLLRKAIARADELPRDVIADKSRADALAVLALDAARAGEHNRALAAIAEALGLTPPARCAVGMTTGVGRAVVVVRGADGGDRGEYLASWRPIAGPPVVSSELARSLASCARVKVMAAAALQGQPRVLPDQIAWSYAASTRGRFAPPATPPPAPRALVVSNVAPPAYLQLEPLSATPPTAGSATVLTGLEATPERVIAAMTDATEIQFHTHALMDVGVSDASHLVLAPDAGGRYALTAEVIRGIELRGHPVIVLAACHSAQGARYQHAPWSLPDAFLIAGARGVFAAATEIPDAESGRFFASVLARVRAGADPAAALRDQRALAGPDAPGWMRDVIVFE